MIRMQQGISSRASPARLRVAIVLVVAGFFAAAVYWHLLAVNNYYYYSWPWKWEPSEYVYPILLPMGIPLVAAQLLYPRCRRVALGLITATALGLMIAGAMV